MGECSGCGKKLGWLEGYFIDNKEWCDKCHPEKDVFLKKNKLNSKEKEFKKLANVDSISKEKFIKNGLQIGLIMLLVILGLLWSLGFFDRNEDKIQGYSSCVDECVSDVDACVFSGIVYDNQKVAWIENGDYEFCYSGLEICVSDCKFDYSK